MSVTQLSLTAARHLHPAVQGLLKKNRRRALPSDLVGCIRQMSLLQIDTINIDGFAVWQDASIIRLGRLPDRLFAGCSGGWEIDAA